MPLQWATWTDLTPTVFLFSRSIDSMGRTKGITGDKPNNHLVLLKPVCLYLYICLAIATHCGSKLQMRFPKDTQLPLRLARLPWLAPLTRLVLLTLLATEGVAGRTSSVFHGCITPKRQGSFSTSIFISRVDVGRFKFYYILQCGHVSKLE